MSRYSSSGLTSYSSYRSPYLDSSSSSSSTSYSGLNYSLPTYESKFESLISRLDGQSRSRAGTSTKYDYLSTYSSKYDYPSASSTNYSSGSSKYAGSTSTSSYGSSSTYASAVDADDLTRSYFEKYYNKAKADAVSPADENRGSRAYSVYLDDSTSGYSSKAPSSARALRSNSVMCDVTDSSSSRGSRYSRLLSQDTEVDSAPSLSSRRHSLAIKSTLDRDDDPTYVSSTYSRYLDRDKKEEEKSEGDSSYPRTSNYSRYLTRDKEETPLSSGINRRYSLYGDDSSTLTRRDTRAYGGRTETKDKDDRTFSSQNGYDKERTESGSSGSAGTSSATTTATAGIGGLKNLGNTCFMNSVIQCLSNTRLLVDYLLSDEYSTDINTTNSSMKGSLVKAFAALIKGLWKPAARIIDPSSLKGAVQRFAPRFSGYNQEDSQEFLRYLLEGLHEDVNRVSVKPQPINTEIDSDLSVEEQGMEAWKRYLRRDDSKLVDIFVGQLKSTLRCSTCDYESVTFEPFWDLSLPIPSRSGEVSLNECLEAFTKEEVLDGDEMPTCGRCKTRRRCVKFYSLYKLPRVLVVHLKRFSPTERFRSKLSSTVTFPLTAFDVSRFSDSPGRCTYSCYAVSNHSGTLYSGHYTAYAKNPKTCEWHYFNDSRVSKSSSSNVISNEAYLLFFELLS